MEETVRETGGNKQQKVSPQTFDTLLRNPLYAGWIASVRRGPKPFATLAACQGVIDINGFVGIQCLVNCIERHRVTVLLTDTESAYR